jgi:hypothetical protein
MPCVEQQHSFSGQTKSSFSNNRTEGQKKKSFVTTLSHRIIRPSDLTIQNLDGKRHVAPNKFKVSKALGDSTF